MATLNTRAAGVASDILTSQDSNQAVVLSRAGSGPSSRRGWLFGIGTLGILLASVLLNPWTSPQGASPNIDPTDYAARTKHVLSTTPLIDGHNDLPYLIRSELKHQIYDERFTFNTGLLSNTDRKKLRDGLVGGQFWSSYIHCPKDPETKKDVPLDEATVIPSFLFCAPLEGGKELTVCTLVDTPRHPRANRHHKTLRRRIPRSLPILLQLNLRPRGVWQRQNRQLHWH